MRVRDLDGRTRADDKAAGQQTNALACACALSRR